jgi:hypothetical protein
LKYQRIESGRITPKFCCAYFSVAIKVKKVSIEQCNVIALYCLNMAKRFMAGNYH